MNANEICVPDRLLADSGEAGEALAPEVGDSISLAEVQGTVTRRENGQTYLQVTSANGQPIDQGGAAATALPGEDGAIEEEIRTGNYRGGGMLVALVLLCLLVFGAVAKAADLQFAQHRYCSGTAVSNHVAISTTRQVHSIEINNYSGATLYLLIFDSSTNQLAGATPHITDIAIPTGSTGGKNWGEAGMPFERGVNACLSTTPYSLTNASAGGVLTITSSNRKP